MSAKKKASTPGGGQTSLMSFFGGKGGASTPTSSPFAPTIRGPRSEVAASSPKRRRHGSPLAQANGPKRLRRVLLEDDEDEPKELPQSPKTPRTKSPKAKTPRRAAAKAKTSAQANSDPEWASGAEEEEEEGESSDEPPPSSDEEDDAPTPAKKAKAKKSAKSGIHDASVSFLSSFAQDEDSGGSRGEEQSYEHHSLDFLHPNSIRDAAKRRPDHPDVDTATLHVPKSFLDKKTPGMQQWWTLKAQHFDTVLFFKVGKFYELYHMDAEVGVRELNLTLMRGAFAHVGFPEMAEGRMREELVRRGFRVARVEQTETPDMMKERRKSKGGTKAVLREVCRVTTPGTLGNDQGFRDRNPNTPQPCLLAVTEEAGDGPGDLRLGFAVVNTQTGQFVLGEAADDGQRSFLRTVLARHPPTQLLHPRNPRPSPTSLAVVRTALAAQPQAVAFPAKLDAFLGSLTDPGYLGERDGWPDALKACLSDSDTLGRTPAPHARLALSALAALVDYLRRCLIDADLVGLGRFRWFSGQDEPSEAGEEWWKGRRMVLDGVSLENLNVLECGGEVGGEGSLLRAVDRTETRFGRRLLREWLAGPLLDPEEIASRQTAVQALMDAPKEARDKLREGLRALPDLERALQRVHTLGSKERAENHPESRAIFFDGEKATKAKVKDLLSVIAGFKALLKLHHRVVESSALAKGDLEAYMGRGFPPMTEPLRKLEAAFDREKAEKEAVIVPGRGADAEFDDACDAIDEAKEELRAHLEELKKRLRCSALKYVGSGRSRYQVEMPDTVAKGLGDDFQLTSQRKGFKRFESEESRDWVERLTAAEAAKTAALRDVLRRMFALFRPRDAHWAQAVHAAARLDVLLGFATVAAESPVDFARPTFLHPAQHSGVIRITDGLHPGMAHQADFIPNSLALGGDQPPLMLLTGPNMGGKSTLMRQTALLVILAQTGAFVPARALELSPVRRVFTRLGARDSIVAGQSTFQVEMLETKAVLERVDGHSLVVVDELGRGTGTRDGAAIASAVLAALARLPRPPPALFSTHYHGLTARFKDHPAVLHRHMACMVEKELGDGEEVGEEAVTFLYTLAAGPAPASFGFHAAKLAGLPERLVRRGADVAKRMSGASVLGPLAKVAETLSDEELRQRLARLLAA